MTTDIAIGPTPERIAHAGERYAAAEISHTVKRAYSRATPTLDYLREREFITEDQFNAGDRLRHWIAGMGQPIGLVSSYGQQRWSGTLVSQEISKVTIEWPVYCQDKVRECRLRVGNQRTWEILLGVIADDMTVEDAGKRSCLGRTQAGKVFRIGLQTLADGNLDKLRPKA